VRGGGFRDLCVMRVVMMTMIMCGGGRRAGKCEYLI
jgi:hypothetical protein